MFWMMPVGILITIVCAAYTKLKFSNDDCPFPLYILILIGGTLLSGFSGIIVPILAIFGILYLITSGLSSVLHDKFGVKRWDEQ
jgi:hypothetical protein